MRLRCRVSMLVATLVAGLLTGSVPAGAASTSAAAASVTLIGHGYGHGRGLAQWGAYGYAVDAGWSARTILDHYYGGTTQGTAGNSEVTVRLTVLDGAPTTWIIAGQGFSVGGWHIDAGSAARVVRSGAGWQLFTAFGGCATTTQFGPYPLAANPTVVTDGDTGDDPRRMLTTCANGTSYRGRLTLVDDGGATRVVNSLPLESYLRGVVPRESVASWGDAAGGRGMQALAAQAVAARSYVLSERRWSYAQTCDTIACQVYGGAALGGARVEDPRTDFAISASAGVIRVRDGAVVRTEFASSSGGWTTGPSFGHVHDYGDVRSPYASWRVDLAGSTIAAAYPQIGQFSALVVSRRDGEGVQGGRVLAVDVVGTAGRVTVTGEQFRGALGLRSGWFFPVQQATAVRYVKLPFGDTVYRLMSVNGWSERMPISFAEWSAAGYPSPGLLRTDVVKYSWASTLYAATFWPGDPTIQWDTLDFPRWSAAGFPPPRIAGWIYGTMYWQNPGSPIIYAQTKDGIVHALTYAEWGAAGYPKPEQR